MADVDSGRFAQGRHAGVIVPLFSIPSRRSWGIGEIPDLPHLAAWLSSAGFDFVQLLPINEMERGQNSPYSALSAMALDPLYIAIEDLPDFAAAGGLAALGPAMSAAIDEARRAAGVQYSTIREAKARARLGGATARSSPRRAGRGARAARAGRALLPVLPMDCRHTVAPRARTVRDCRVVRRFPLRRQRPQR
jgi:4-alpha-glucanotransferase